MHSTFDAIRRRDLLILDTGPIWELVLFHAVYAFGFERLKRELRFITDVHAFDKCGQFIASFRRRTTSASVVAELHHWIRRTQPQGQLKLWNRVYDEFRGMGMDEEVVKLLEMDPEMVTSFGPVDVSLLRLAQRYLMDVPVLLTVDQPLFGECEKAGVEVRLLQRVAADY